MTRRAYDEVEHSRVRPRIDDGPLFQAPAPSVPVATSEATAAKLDTPEGKRKRATDRMTLLALIASRLSGYTSDELDAVTGMGGDTIRPRVDELRTQGWVTTSETETRPTRRQRRAFVHFVTDDGLRGLRAAAGRDAVREAA